MADVKELFQTLMQEQTNATLATLRSLSGSTDYPNIILVGSRRVLRGDPALTDETDWDFAMCDDIKSRDILKTLGFEEKYFGGLLESGYGDNSTTEVFQKKLDKSDQYLPIQVVLKQPTYWKPVIEFWKVMARNKEVFRTQFWKSYRIDGVFEGSVNYPTTQEQIRDRLNHWLEYVIPSFCDVTYVNYD